MVTVSVWESLSSAMEGRREFDVDATNIRELFQELEERFPATEPFIKQGIAVSIDGVIYRDEWSKPLPENAEIFLLPRLAGG